MGYDDELDDEEDIDENDYDEDDMDEPKKSKNQRRGASPGSEGSEEDEEEEEEEEGIGAWGKSKKDLYNADQIETEADALEEEQETKRLQQKHLQTMNEEDFGFDETEWADSGEGQEDATKNDTEVTEVLPQAEITDDMSEEEKLKILKSRYPEFEPLAKDFVDLQPTHRNLKQAAETAEKAHNTEDEAAPIAVVKFRALSAYLGTIGMYFMLLASPSEDASGKLSPLSPAQLRGHPVMGSLVKFRKVWENVKGLTIPEVSEGKDEQETEEVIQTEQPEPTKTKKTEKKRKDTQEQKQTKKLSKAQRAAQTEAEARRAEKLRETEANLADLSTLATDASKKRKTQKTKASAKNAEDSDFGDEDALTAKEAEEKAKQKRSLRFYTSQIAQKANKRNAAGRDAGGDTDIPYRERLKDRQERLNAEAERRGKQQPAKGEQLGGESDEEDYKMADKIRGDESGSDDDDYYDMVAARSKQRKDEKKTRAEAHAEAARQGGQVAVQEEIGPDGKRAITYQIEKNKGLAPKRNKDARNPRVKKRKRFEDKKKKLGSIRQQYKGGEGRGGYGGELTGIKKNLVKSVKL